MLYFSKLRILSITLISLILIIIATSNFFKFDKFFLDKKINLGLDLQGGSYLLLEIDNLEGLCFIEIKLLPGKRSELGRPKETPLQCKNNFIYYGKNH